MTPSDVREILNANSITIISEKDINGGQGVQFKCENSAILAAYNSGKIVIQGKNTEKLNTLFGATSSNKSMSSAVAEQKQSLRKVFVVYGHDKVARDELEAMLRRWGLTPIILDQLTSGGQTIIEKLEDSISDVTFAVVLATPDDQGYRSNHKEEEAFRARQNIVLELGMMLTKLGRDRVAVLMSQQENMERPSDIQGLLYIPFKDCVQDAALQLAKEINAKGISIDLSKI